MEDGLSRLFSILNVADETAYHTEALEHTNTLTNITYSEVLRDKLFIGDFESPKAIFKLNIKAVVSLGTLKYVHYDGIKYKHIVIEDDKDSDILKHLIDATDFIDYHIKQNIKVLVHCQAGVSRSATICIAYLMKYYDLPFSVAFLALKGARPIINPNIGFLKQLIKFQEHIKK